jgi:hypothetical protein
MTAAIRGLGSCPDDSVPGVGEFRCAGRSGPGGREKSSWVAWLDGLQPLQMTVGAESVRRTETSQERQAGSAPLHYGAQSGRSRYRRG